mmetsp:Transcript_2445/g.6137  ORF Transcript_2445/g.6137 Transcript_2445/m.6137 type:complete len:237 (-) Transcript_2445:43-753(-)
MSSVGITGASFCNPDDFLKLHIFASLGCIIEICRDASYCVANLQNIEHAARHSSLLRRAHFLRRLGERCLLSEAAALRLDVLLQVPTLCLRLSHSAPHCPLHNLPGFAGILHVHCFIDCARSIHGDGCTSWCILSSFACQAGCGQPLSKSILVVASVGKRDQVVRIVLSERRERTLLCLHRHRLLGTAWAKCPPKRRHSQGPEAEDNAEENLPTTAERVRHDRACSLVRLNKLRQL